MSSSFPDIEKVRISNIKELRLNQQENTISDNVKTTKSITSEEKHREKYRLITNKTNRIINKESTETNSFNI